MQGLSSQCLWLTLPLAGCAEDVRLQATSEATTTKRVALARNAPCLAHNKKTRRFVDAGFSGEASRRQRAAPSWPFSSEKTISTRRFCARPRSLAFTSTGYWSP